MAMEDRKPIDSEINDSIAMLEQILEVMPQDMIALKALYNAYRQNGQQDRAFGYLESLANVIYGSADAHMANFVIEQLSSFEDSHPGKVAVHRERMHMFAAEKSSMTADASSHSTTMTNRNTVDINEELTLAWKLYEENQLSQEEYSSVLHDLTEVSSKELDVPVSVLHVLHDRGFNQMNRIMNYMSSRSGVPVISLSAFELKDKMAEVLPMTMPIHSGILPFAFFGNDLLVAVLNPYNNNLIDQVEKASGHRCHTYLVASEDYDAALGRLRGLVKR